MASETREKYFSGIYTNSPFWLCVNARWNRNNIPAFQRFGPLICRFVRSVSLCVRLFWSFLSVHVVHVGLLRPAVPFVTAPREDKRSDSTPRLGSPERIIQQSLRLQPSSRVTFVIRQPPEIRGGAAPGSMRVRRCVARTLSRFPLMCQKSEGM